MIAASRSPTRGWCCRYQGGEKCSATRNSSYWPYSRKGGGRAAIRPEAELTRSICIFLSGRRQPLFRVATPFSGLPLVTLFSDTWHLHSLPNRPYLIGREDWISATVSSPSAVCGGTTNPGYLAFVNQTITSPGRGSPLVAFADPLDQVVVTAGYRLDFRNLSLHWILWVP